MQDVESRTKSPTGFIAINFLFQLQNTEKNECVVQKYRVGYCLPGELFQFWGRNRDEAVTQCMSYPSRQKPGPDWE